MCVWVWDLPKAETKRPAGAQTTDTPCVRRVIAHSCESVPVWVRVREGGRERYLFVEAELVDLRQHPAHAPVPSAHQDAEVVELLKQAKADAWGKTHTHTHTRIPSGIRTAKR